ncbi:MAG: TonB-dependent receptor, partial [Flavobacteriaceae bacterium]|nr:TonB-dependent receptor [Flavobacteriaceae bacterium]
QQTNFGTFEEPRALLIFFEGQEDDEYNSYMGALKTSYKASENTNLHLSTSVYHTQEQEHFSILAQYLLGDVNTDIGSQDFGSIQSAQGIGSQLENGRNDLDAIIANIELKGDTQIGTDLVEWGVKFQHEDFRDRLREFEVIDSAGFSIRPPGSQFINDQPYNAFDAPLVPFTGARAINDVQVNRFSGFAQYSGRTFWNNNEIWYNLGVRAQRWDVSGAGINSADNFIISPRAQFAIKPNWKRDMIFRFATGLYQQPPFYREFRDQTGAVNPDVDAQKSLHFVLGHDYSFKMWGRPFKLVSEFYYKDMTDINRFTVENVRIRYVANNDADAYAVGFDTRLNGEFVPGTDSWVSIGYLKTLERFDERGYISRPTDQRLKVGVLFQDYVPNMPSLRMYLNMVYNTGVPGGSPSFADPHDFQFRLDDYFRADVGIFYVLADQKRRKNGGWLDDFQEFTLGFEIFNVFDRLNTITNTWVRDAATKQEFAVPNFLTARVFNLRMSVKI